MEEKEIKIKESKTPRRRSVGGRLLKLFLLLLTIMFFSVAGGVLTLWSYPVVNDWLISRGFIKTDVLNLYGRIGNTSNTSNGSKTVIYDTQEQAVTDIVKKSMDAVVSIAISNVQLSNQQGVVDNVSNIGTGFIVDPSGVIVTNQHVVSDATADYKVVTADGKEYSVVKILQDDVNDIAILKIEAQGLKTLSLGNSDNLEQGQTVIAIGTPLGEYAGSVTTGVVSGLNRSVTATSQGFWGVAKTYENVIQTDAAINPGNSGGPLLNLNGEVVGINFATTSGANNISFALPVNRIKTRIDEYRKYGKFIKPYVGLEYQMISADQAKYYKDVVAGALVRRVVPDSPAAKADIQKMDIITEINGNKVVDSFANIIQQYKVGEEITLKIWRAGKELTVKVKLEEVQ